MKELITIIFFLFSMQPLSYANSERYQEMQRWLRAHEAEQQQQTRDEEQQKKQEADKVRNCARAKDRVESYERAGGLYIFNEKGERQYLNKQKRAEAEDRARNEVEKWCK